MLRAPLNEEPVYDDAGHDGLVGVARLFTEEPANVEEVKDVKDGAVESDVKVGVPSSATSAAVISGGGDHDWLLLLLEDNSRKVTHAHGSEQINGLPVNLNVINLDCRLVGDEMGGEAGDLVAQALGGDDGNLFQDLLVGVEVEGHARVVALDDLAGGFLHCLRAYATHGCFSGGEEEGCGFSLEQRWWLG
nr:hypothetical protein EUGRSUZ_K00772 [Ipomoea batatas]